MFIKEGLKISNETLSGNGALKYATSGDDFIDNFAAISTFKEPRSYEEVAEDMRRLWSQDPLKCLKLAIYIRMITRDTKIFNGNIFKDQKGQGLKNEGILRMFWLAINHSNTFAYNILTFIAIGSWKDIFTMLNLDLQYNGWNNRKLNWRFLLNVILIGLNNPNTTHLVRKYLPTIRTNSKAKTLEAQCDTIIGRWIANNLFKTDSYKNYRKLKSEGVAHEWQQLISKQLYDQIKFNNISGRALQKLVNSKFLKNHGLYEKYVEWIKSKSIVKYTGFVFELFKPLEPRFRNKGGYSYDDIDDAQIAIINAQFNNLVKKGNINSNFIVARDISGSMAAQCKGCGMSSYSVAKALALYFSEFLKGPFANHYIEFADECRIVEWKGITPVDKWINDTNYNFGSTNFIKIVYLFTEIKKRGVNESDFPDGLLCLSDGEFSECADNVTNFNKFRDILKEAGFSKEYVENFKLILWDIPNYYYGKQKTTFEEFADSPNSYQMSGYDPSIISFLMNGEYNPCNSKELFESIMNQELLNTLKVIKD